MPFLGSDAISVEEAWACAAPAVDSTRSAGRWWRDRLARLRADRDPEAAELWRDHAALLKAGLAARFDGAAGPLSNDDFELAMDVMGKLA